MRGDSLLAVPWYNATQNVFVKAVYEAAARERTWIAKRDALAPFVSTAFQSFWRHPNAVQSTVPLEGLDLVSQGL